jgi:hypothetical protein
MRCMSTGTRESFFSADDGGVCAVQANGNKVAERRLENTLYKLK